MKQCLRITFTLDSESKFLQDTVKKYAYKLEIEGAAQVIEGRIKIVACGMKDNMERFIDVLHKGSKTARPDDVEVEPFLKDKEYRGVFRVIE